MNMDIHLSDPFNSEVLRRPRKTEVDIIAEKKLQLETPEFPVSQDLFDCVPSSGGDTQVESPLADKLSPEKSERSPSPSLDDEDVPTRGEADDSGDERDDIGSPDTSILNSPTSPKPTFYMGEESMGFNDLKSLNIITPTPNFEMTQDYRSVVKKPISPIIRKFGREEVRPIQSTQALFDLSKYHDIIMKERRRSDFESVQQGEKKPVRRRLVFEDITNKKPGKEEEEVGSKPDFELDSFDEAWAKVDVLKRNEPVKPKENISLVAAPIFGGRKEIFDNSNADFLGPACFETPRSEKTDKVPGCLMSVSQNTYKTLLVDDLNQIDTDENVQKRANSKETFSEVVPGIAIGGEVVIESDSVDKDIPEDHSVVQGDNNISSKEVSMSERTVLTDADLTLAKDIPSPTKNLVTCKVDEVRTSEVRTSEVIIEEVGVEVATEGEQVDLVQASESSSVTAQQTVEVPEVIVDTIDLIVEVPEVIVEPSELIIEAPEIIVETAELIVQAPGRVEVSLEAEAQSMRVETPFGGAKQSVGDITPGSTSTLPARIKIQKRDNVNKEVDYNSKRPKRQLILKREFEVENRVYKKPKSEPEEQRTPVNCPEIVRKLFRETEIPATGFPSYPPEISRVVPIPIPDSPDRPRKPGLTRFGRPRSSLHPYVRNTVIVHED